MRKCHLSSIGLVTSSWTSGYAQSSVKNQCSFSYFDEEIKVILDKGQLFTGYILMAQAGNELSKLFKAKKNDDFLRYLKIKIQENSKGIV